MAALNKRKRDAHDVAGGRAAPATNQSNADFDSSYLQTDEDSMVNNIDFAAALAASNADASENTDQQNRGQAQSQGQNTSDTAAAAIAQYHTMTVPQSTEQSFMTQATDRDSSMVDQGGSSGQGKSSNFTDYEVPGAQSSPNGDSTIDLSLHGAQKPAVGSDEWHKVRRDNHKEVERRRRETINEGINELAKIVPGCEKNKGSILQRAVQFITQLKDNETQNIEKWTLEKLLTEQAIAELSSSCDKLKAECQRAWAECEQWKKAAQKAGVVIDSDDKADAEAEDAE